MFSLTMTEVWNVFRVRTQINLNGPDHLEKAKKCLIYEVKDLRVNK